MEVAHDLDSILPRCDVLNLLRIQFERQSTRPFPSVREYALLYAMNRERLARAKRDILILARTDARGVEGLEAAVQRARAYVDAGADVIFPEALESAEEFRTFAAQLAKQGSKVPLVANMTEFGKSPLLILEELAELGYSAVLYPVTLLRVAMKACEAALNLIAADGSQQDLLDLMQTREELYDLLDYKYFEERDRAHAAAPIPDDQ